MRLLLAGTLILFLTHLSMAQSHSPPGKNRKNEQTLIWGTVGYGVIAPGFGGLLRLAYGWDDVSSVSTRIVGATTIDFFNLPNDITEYSFFYGRYLIDDFYMLRAAAGPAYFKRNLPSTVYRRFGIGIEGEAMLKFKFIGFGLMFTYLFAKDISLPGFTVNFSVGKLE